MDSGRKKDPNAPSSSDPIFVPKPSYRPGRFGAIGEPLPVDKKARFREEKAGITLTIGENRGDMIAMYKRKNHVYTEYDTDPKGAAASPQRVRQIERGSGEYHSGVDAFQPISDSVLKGRDVSTVRMNNIHPPGKLSPTEIHEQNAQMAATLHQNLPEHVGRIYSVGITRNNPKISQLAMGESEEAMKKSGFIPVHRDIFERGGHQPTDYSNQRNRKLSTDVYHNQTKYVHESTPSEVLREISSYYQDKVRNPSINPNKGGSRKQFYRKL